MSAPVANLADFVSAADVERLQGPIDQAVGLPGRAYGEAFYRLEQRSLFPRGWCVVGVGAQVPEPGDVMPIDLAGWPLVAIRSNAGEVRCFHNICRHRANKLVHEPGTGHKRLSCSWHGWTYDLEGRLVSTPDLGGGGVQEAPGFCRETLGLRAVRTARWLDFIFVNLDDQAPSLDQHLEPLQSFLSHLDLSDMRHAHAYEYAYSGNWKVTIEGGIEDYHVPWGHAQLIKGMKSRFARIDTGSCFAATTSTLEYGPEGAPTRYRSAELPILPGLDPQAPPSSCIINVFPLGMMGFMGDHMMLGHFAPDGWAHTRVLLHYYFVGEAATDPALASVREKIIAGWTEVITQDTPYVRDVHDMYQVRDEALISTRFSPHWEGAVLHFQRMLVKALSDA